MEVTLAHARVHVFKNREHTQVVQVEWYRHGPREECWFTWLECLGREMMEQVLGLHSIMILCKTAGFCLQREECRTARMRIRMTSW